MLISLLARIKKTFSGVPKPEAYAKGYDSYWENIPCPYPSHTTSARQWAQGREDRAEMSVL